MLGPKPEPWPALTAKPIGRRDGKHCVHCGTTENLTVQHRAVKGSGGRNSAEAPANGILLCWPANVELEQDGPGAEHGRSMGWKLSTHADPTEVPFFDASTGEWWQPDNDWQRRRVVS
jgi:hypothetical protein